MVETNAAKSWNISSFPITIHISYLGMEKIMQTK